ncbi:hypothetical protein Hanom_Chr08g00690651 [Helianthus anomalus]
MPVSSSGELRRWQTGVSPSAAKMVIRVMFGNRVSFRVGLDWLWV